MEENCRINEIETFLRESKEKVSCCLHEFTMQHWKSKFEKLLPKLCQRHFLFVPGASEMQNKVNIDVNVIVNVDINVEIDIKVDVNMNIMIC